MVACGSWVRKGKAAQPRLLWWNISSGKLLHTAALQERPLFISFLPDKEMLISADNSGAIAWWNVKTGNLRRLLSPRPLRTDAIAILPANRMIASAGSYDIALRDVYSGDLKKLINFPRGLDIMIFSKNGKTLIGAGEGNIYLWDMAHGRLKATLPGQTFEINALSLSPDDDKLVSGDSFGQITIWKINNFE